MEHQFKRNYVSRLNLVGRTLAELHELFSEIKEETTSKGDLIGEFRQHLNDLNQCFHEFSAYLNTYNTYTEHREDNKHAKTGI